MAFAIQYDRRAWTQQPETTGNMCGANRQCITVQTQREQRHCAPMSNTQRYKKNTV